MPDGIAGWVVNDAVEHGGLVRGLGGTFQFLGKQRLRAGGDHIVRRSHTVGHEPAIIDGPVQGDRDAHEVLRVALQHVSPAGTFRPHDGCAGHNRS